MVFTSNRTTDATTILSSYFPFEYDLVIVTKPSSSPARAPHMPPLCSPLISPSDQQLVMLACPLFQPKRRPAIPPAKVPSIRPVDQQLINRIVPEHWWPHIPPPASTNSKQEMTSSFRRRLFPQLVPLAAPKLFLSLFSDALEIFTFSM